jgi:stringent starvation protein B
MDLVKTKCKQINENHITEDITVGILQQIQKVYETSMEEGKNLKCCQGVLLIGKDRQIKLNIGKTFINAMRMDNAKIGNEAHFMSFVAISLFPKYLPVLVYI